MIGVNVEMFVYIFIMCFFYNLFFLFCVFLIGFLLFFCRFMLILFFYFLNRF